MDRLTVYMVKAAFCWMIAGFCVGALMLTDDLVPGAWHLWMQPTHGHMLFVGWFVQFALGIAYWLLPRKRSAARPIGYSQNRGFLGMWLLNIGLIARVIGEPMQRTDGPHALVMTLLVVSAIGQVVAILIFISQLWPRVYGKDRLSEQMARKAQGS